MSAAPKERPELPKDHALQDLLRYDQRVRLIEIDKDAESTLATAFKVSKQLFSKSFKFYGRHLYAIWFKLLQADAIAITAPPPSTERGRQLAALMIEAQNLFFEALDAHPKAAAEHSLLTAYNTLSPMLRVSHSHAFNFFDALKELERIHTQMWSAGPRKPEWELKRELTPEDKWLEWTNVDLKTNYNAFESAVYLGPLLLEQDDMSQFPARFTHTLQAYRNEHFPTLIQNLFRRGKKFFGFHVSNGYWGDINNVHPNLKAAMPELNTLGALDRLQVNRNRSHVVAAAIWVSKDNRVCWIINPACEFSWLAVIEQVAAKVAAHFNFYPQKTKMMKPWFVPSGVFAAINGFETLRRNQLTAAESEAVSNALLGGACYAISKVQSLLLLACSKGLLRNKAKNHERLIDLHLGRIVASFRDHVAINTHDFMVEWYVFVLWCAYANPSDGKLSLLSTLQ